MQNSEMKRYCENCHVNKDISYFKKYGKVCKECKDKNASTNFAKFYTNRYKCECGSYISDGNTKEKHDQSFKHRHYMKYGKGEDTEQLKEMRERRKFYKENKSFLVRNDDKTYTEYREGKPFRIFGKDDIEYL